MSKLHVDKHIDLEITTDEFDLTSVESKATYEKIRNYVAENNDGMKVTNLYIAQVKAKHGIIERENYNLPKSENSRQPQCPDDKAKAIEEALRYFQMI
ncbi:MAG: 23S rRNA methyltransferase [Pseudobutyrivibrio sp.]|nr:23S rRNA methyltransferase [Pseudobutyrivibrio sp.]